MQFNILMIIIVLEVIQSVHCASSRIVEREVAETGEIGDRKKVDYYDYRHIFAEGVSKALTECREKFKWDRWNCPKKAFLDILDRNPLPSNKELGYSRALIAANIVSAFTRSCSYGTNDLCACNQSKFVWRGCDEVVKFGFKVSKIYLESQDDKSDEASRRINRHNFEVGRVAVKKSMKKICKCNGVSGSCQVNTCWTGVPDMVKVGQYLKRQYKRAAKVGAKSAEETNIESLNKELSTINTGQLVFADPSPDYCYENASLGINGTLGRYCSKTEKDSCDRLCTKCGYKIQSEEVNVEKQCDCRFVYCCEVECKRCPHVKRTHKCVKHS